MKDAMGSTGRTTITSTLSMTIPSSVNEDIKGPAQRNPGAIAGGVIAGIEGLILVVLGIWLLWKRMKARKRLPSDYISTGQGNWDDVNKKEQNSSDGRSQGWNFYIPQRAPASQTQGTKTAVSIALHIPFQWYESIIWTILMFAVFRDVKSL